MSKINEQEKKLVRELVDNAELSICENCPGNSGCPEDFNCKGVRKLAKQILSHPGLFFKVRVDSEEYEHTHKVMAHYEKDIPLAEAIKELEEC